MTRIAKTIQGLIVASTLLGIALLFEIYAVVPLEVFEIVSIGWVCFVIDCFLTFIRPNASFCIGLILSILGLSASLPQSTHWEFIQEGQLVPSAIFITGSIMQGIIVVLS
ncbi:MAG TPA: hypothetical protein VEC08_06210, partial [Nitrososphaerales archaeon]|nr:hypothetical protein [Nitrososphaerales archaeon]